MIDNAVSEDVVVARLRAWLKGVTGFDDGHVIKDHPGAPRPLGSYAMVNVISAELIAEMGCRLYEHPEGDEEDEGESGGPDLGPMVERRAADWEWIVSVNVYGLHALDIVRRLVNSTRSPTINSTYLRPMVFRRVSTVRKLPELIERHWENRAQVDVTVAGCALDGFLVDIIESGVVRMVRVPLPELLAPYQKPGD